jgi:hypothetical protein
MFLQASSTVKEGRHHGPLPDSAFIEDSQPVARPVPLTTATKQGKLAAKTLGKAPGKDKATTTKKLAWKRKATELMN